MADKTSRCSSPYCFDRLGVRIILSLVACIALTSVAGLFRDLRHNRRYIRHREGAKASSQAAVLRAYLEHEMFESGHDGTRIALEAVRGQPNLEDLLILDSKRKVVRALDRKMEGRTVPSPSADGWDGEFIRMDFPIKAKKDCYRCHGRDKQLLGYFEFVVSTVEAYADLKRWQLSHILAESVSLAVICVLVIFIIATMLNRPLSALSAAMAKAGGGDYSVRVPENVSGEMGELARQFNSMAGKLEENRAELERLHRESISHMDRLVSLGELAASLAHEIRNPLAGIAAAIQVLQRDLPAEDRRSFVLTEVLRQVARLNKTVDNLLSYARPAAPVMSSVSLPETAARVLSIVEPQLRKQNVSLETDWSGPVGAVTADQGQMEQILLNLCLNSLQAMPAGGRLRVGVRPSDDGSAAVLEVSDTGVGIPADKLSSIFKPFFTTRAKGTGLGLAIVKKIIESHGGRIEVFSEEGKGARFMVTLPSGPAA